jgi:hypothetical protein
MTAPKTTSEKIRFVADAIARDRPDLAAILRNIKLGRSRERQADGTTTHNQKLADLWQQIDDRVEAGEDESDVLADVGTRQRLHEDFLLDLWLLNGRPEVRAVLKSRGRIP